VYKYFSGKVFLNTFQASPSPEKYQISIESAREVFKYTSPAPEKPGKYLITPFRRRRSIYTHFSGAGEVLMYTYLAPERRMRMIDDNNADPDDDDYDERC